MSFELAWFDFHWPWLFLLAPLPWLVRRLLPPARPGAALAVPFMGRLRALAGGGGGVAGRRPLWLGLLIWLLLLVAAAQPRWLGEPGVVPTSGRDLFLALDISGSMRESDFLLAGEPADRLAVVKRVAGAFIEGRAGDRLGLILFGERPHVRAPLSYDHHAVGRLLGEAEVALAGEYTAVGDAIGLAVKRLRDLDAVSRVAVLLTDGGHNAGQLGPRQAARLAAAYGVRLYTIGIGRQDAAGPNPYGVWSTEGAAAFDRELLETVAEMTGGRYFHALDREGLEAAWRELDRLEPALGDALKSYRATALYPWPLGAALVLSLWLALRPLLAHRVWRRG